MVLKYFSGDGIDININNTNSVNSKIPKNIIISNNYIYSCNRQGISIEHANNVTVNNNIIYNIIGTDPASCIDIEPLSINFYVNKNTYDYIYESQYADNITLQNNLFNNYKVLYTYNNTGDVIIRNNEIYGRMLFRNSDGIIDLSHNKISNNTHINNIPKLNNRTITLRTISDIVDNYINNNENSTLAYEDNMVEIGYNAKGYNINNEWSTVNKSSPNYIFINDNDIDIDSFYYATSEFIEFTNNRIASNTTFKFPDIKKTWDYNTKIYFYNNYNKNGSAYSGNINLSNSGSEPSQNSSSTYKQYRRVNERIDTNYIKIIEPPTKQVYWIKENGSDTFDATGMKIGYYKFNPKVGTSDSSITTNGTIKITNNNDTFSIGSCNVSFDKNITQQTTVLKVTLTCGSNKYYAYQKIRVKVSTSSVRNYIENTGIFSSGTNVSSAFSIFSDSSSINSEHPNVNLSIVPSEYITWKINDENRSVINEQDMEKTNIKITATYLGISLSKTFKVSGDGLILSKYENSRTNGFLGSNIKNSNLIRERISQVHILSSDEYNSMSSDLKNTIFSDSHRWHVGKNDGVEIIGGYFVNGNNMYNVYIAPDTIQSGIKVKANKDSSYLFNHIGYNMYCLDKTVIHGLNNLDTSDVVSMESMFAYTGYNALTQLELGDSFDTSNVTNMESMFEQCGHTSMTKLVLGNNFDTSKVTNMKNMFRYCGNQYMDYIKLGSKWNFPSNNTNTSNMFLGVANKNKNIYTQIITNNISNTPSDTGINNDYAVIVDMSSTTIGYIINHYEYSHNNSIIDQIEPNTNLADYEDNITLYNGFKLSVELGGKSYIYTGCITKIYNNDTLVNTLTNIVRGDINGDGELSPLDYIKVKNHIMGTNTISSEIYQTAADVNDDDNISPLDYVKIKNYIMNN